MNTFDRLLDETLQRVWLDVLDVEDRNRERCDTGRPHNPVGSVIDIVMHGCRCRRHEPPKEWRGLAGIVEATTPPEATILWYGNIGDRRQRVARMVELDGIERCTGDGEAHCECGDG